MLKYVRKADSRRQTRSTRRWGQQTDAQFWSNQPDPLLIERGQVDAIQLVRSTVNRTPETATVYEPMEMNATATSGVPPMVFVDDERTKILQTFWTPQQTVSQHQ